MLRCIDLCLYYSKAQGYQEGDYTLHHKLTVTNFLEAGKFLERLSVASEVAYYVQAHYIMFNCTIVVLFHTQMFY